MSRTVTKGGRRGEKSPWKNFHPPGKMCWCNRCKIHAIDVKFEPPQKTLRLPWYPKLVTGLHMSQLNVVKFWVAIHPWLTDSYSVSRFLEQTCKLNRNEKSKSNRFENWNVGMVFWFEQHSTWFGDLCYQLFTLRLPTEFIIKCNAKIF